MKNKIAIFRMLSIIFSVACMALMIIFVYDRQQSTAVWGIIAFLWALLFHIFFKHNQKKGEDPQAEIRRRSRR